MCVIGAWETVKGTQYYTVLVEFQEKRGSSLIHSTDNGLTWPTFPSPKIKGFSLWSPESRSEIHNTHKKILLTEPLDKWHTRPTFPPAYTCQFHSWSSIYTPVVPTNCMMYAFPHVTQPVRYAKLLRLFREGQVTLSECQTWFSAFLFVQIFRDELSVCWRWM